METIVDIVAAPPGWFARWRFGPDITRSYPVTVWAMVQDEGTGRRHVVGVDAGGQWPGGTDNEPGADFLRYVFQPVGAGAPDDAFNPVQGSPGTPG
jgi:hypothetical protein